ncbi:MAG: site-specific DNA-methyltransferase [Candidatus Moeniiplasma glomeromycotorum]|nr:site-specific DNA-methyltransferase [Candidatus Moeniiplasma glomeromycotorum]
MNYTHKNKIDFIYIDPPYNTGSDGFRYRDRRVLDKYPDGSEVPKDHPFRHSYWLSFMRKRLELAKELMKDSGVIFISIDINELAQLKLLCDNIFGESNLVSLISVKVKPPAGVGQSSFIFDVCEYVLMYAKNIKAFKDTHQDSPEKLPADYEPLTEKQENYNKIMLNFGELRLVKEILQPSVGLVKIYQCENYSTKTTTDLTLKEYIKNREIVFRDSNASGGIQAIKSEIPSTGLSCVEYKPTKGKSAGNITKVYFLNGMRIIWLSSVTRYEKGKLFKRTKATNFWSVSSASLHAEGGVYFTNGKKPLKLLQKLLGMFKNKDAIVLDFFAGSGTTGEAAIIQNEEDGLNRQFILVTNNDEITNGKTQKIMDDVCWPRMKNAIKGYANREPFGNSIKYYRTAFVGENSIFNANDKDKMQLTHCAGELLAIAENTLEQIEKNEYWQIFENEQQITTVYFREEQDQLKDFVEKVTSFNKKIVVYVFSWQEKIELFDFQSKKNIRLKAIPQPILEIYRQIHNLI